MVVCETPDFTFPMLADVYHPIVNKAHMEMLKRLGF